VLLGLALWCAACHDFDALTRCAERPCDAGSADATSPGDAAGGPDGAADSGANDGGGSGPPQPIGPPGPVALVFHDEFDDTAGMSGPLNGLAADRWNSGWFTTGVSATSPPVSGTEIAWYGPEAIVFPGDGTCRLRLTVHANATYDASHESGMLTTATHFTFSPSQQRTILEARVQVPGPTAEAGGYWPHLWLLSHENGPGGGGQYPPEIGIFSLRDNTTDPRAHLRSADYGVNENLADSDGTVDLSLAFHDYTVDLSPAAIVFYLDGLERWRYTDGAGLASLFAFDPLYVLINFSLDGSGPLGTVPNDLAIDYVRAWQ
jgi:beta-glucanase (GH16 family)